MESPFKYIHEQFIKGNSFGTMEELNRRGREFVNSWCDRMHTTTRRIPNQHYLLEEKQALLPLPKKHYRHKELQPRIVSPDSYVSIDTNKYSVPVSYVGKTLYYRMVYGFRIELYDRNENPVMKMERSYEKHDVRTDKGHYAEIAVPFSTGKFTFYHSDLFFEEYVLSGALSLFVLVICPFSVSIFESECAQFRLM